MSRTDELISAAQLARVAHELNNSLAPAIALLEVLRGEFREGSQSAAFADVVRNAVAEATRLAQELGEMARRARRQSSASDPRLSPAEVSAVAAPGQLPCRRVLYVDDDPTVRTTLSLMLRRLNQEVDCSETGPHAIEMFREKRYDLVITDLRMASMSGEILCHILKQVKPDVPVLLLTGWSEAAMEVQGNAGQPDGILTKPLTLGRLREALSEVFCGGGGV